MLLKNAPIDEHNETLLSLVHPKDWPMPVSDEPYQLLVIGAGAGGLVSAAGAAGLGARVALIEEELLGGDCLNMGCVPSKALLRCARAAQDVREAAEFGVEVEGEPKVNFAKVMERMRRLRAEIAPNDSAERFTDLGVDVYLGRAVFTSPHTVEVNGRTLKFKRAIIATGGRPAVPPIPGLKEAGFLTNRSLFDLEEQPRRLAIIGAGPIGCEMAQAFRRFGSEVYLLEGADRLMPKEDPEASEVIDTVLRREGVQIRLGNFVSKVSKTEQGRVLEVNGEEIVVDEILVAAGRMPNVNGLGLDAAGVVYDERAGVKVGDDLRTSASHIFAVGDVAFTYKFTHTADATARIALQNSLFPGRAKGSSLTIPWSTYTEPEVAHVGLTPEEAQRRGVAIQTFTQPLKDLDRAILEGATEGFAKVHVKAGTDEIVGATVVGPHAGDLISEVTVAMVGKVGLKTFASTIHPYPTLAEVWKRVGDAYNRTRLTPLASKVLSFWLRWFR